MKQEFVKYISEKHEFSMNISKIFNDPFHNKQKEDHLFVAQPDHVFELLKFGTIYKICQKTTGHLEIPRGCFTFVILADDPGCVYCGKTFDMIKHLSLTGGKDVFMLGSAYLIRVGN